MWALFRNGPPLIWLPLLLNNFINFKPLVYVNLLFCYCSSALQSFAQGFLNGTCIAKIVKIVSLDKKTT